jgi:acetate kinase
MTRVLVLNSGSSSLKYRLFDDAETIDDGVVERIGESGGDAADHRAAGLSLDEIETSLTRHGLEGLGIAIDPGLNERNAQQISRPGSRTTVYVIAADEELEIADQSRRALGLLH